MFGIFRSIGHHLAIVRDSLRAEKEAPKQRSRSRNELEFLPAVLEVTETPPATIGRGIIWTIIAFVVAAITWAFLGELDIVAVAPGKLVSTAGNMPIQPVEIGVVRTVYVRDGQAVSAGDPILELDPTETAADAERLAAELLQSRLDIARLEALLAPDPPEAFEPPAEATIVQIGRQMALLRSQWQRHQESLKNYVGEVAVLEAETASLRSEAESLT
ncbi:MAG: biotin/lipoyl-binding protein, partial [Rhodospirillales bacterium]